MNGHTYNKRVAKPIHTRPETEKLRTDLEYISRHALRCESPLCRGNTLALSKKLDQHILSIMRLQVSEKEDLAQAF